MLAFEYLKILHVSCAGISIAGFSLRGYWMLTANPLLQYRAARTLPHLVDTVLLGSAISMLFLMQVSPLQMPWLMAKVIALLLYIGLGMVALRFGKSRRSRLTCYVLALMTAGYMVSVALSRSVFGFLVYTWG